MKPSSPGCARRGIVLILLSGVVTLLLFLAILFLQMSRLGRLRQGATLDAAAADLAAASGMHYAASRLSAEGYPAYRASVAERGDSWLCREPSSTGEPPRNPSYAHGEPWLDAIPLDANGLDDDADGRADEALEGAGVFTPGETFADADRDGAFSARSGRLRLGNGAGGAFFSLRIVAPEGGIPVNGGLDASLEHALNNLGAVALAPGSAPGREEIPAGADGDGDGQPDGERISASRLGTDLLASRPPGGYRSLETVWELALRPRAYPRAAFERIAPYLDLGPHEGFDPAFYRRGGAAPYLPVCWAAAPQAVLESLWRYLSCRKPHHLPGSDAGWTLVSRRTCASAPARLSFKDLVPMIFPAEAGRLASLALDRRETGDRSWSGLYRAIGSGSALLFGEDFQDLDEDGIPATWSANQRSWLGMKTDLAFQSVALDSYPYPCFTSRSDSGCDFYFGAYYDDFYGAWYAREDPSFTWGTWNVDRYPDDPLVPESLGLQLARWIGTGQIHRIPPFPAVGAPWPDPKMPYMSLGAALAPLGLSTAPPSLYEIASFARSGSAVSERSGRLRVSRRHDFASQADFESLTPAGPPSARKGLRILEDPPPPARLDVPSTGRPFPRVATLPALLRVPYAGTPVDLSAGALSLGGSEAGRLAAKVYFPFTQDFDGSAANDLRSETAGAPFLPVKLVSDGTPVEKVNPFEISGRYNGTAPKFDFPGMQGNPLPFTYVNSFSIECWMTANSLFKLRGVWAGEIGTIQIWTLPFSEDPAKQVTRFSVGIDWPPGMMLMDHVEKSWDLEDRLLPPPRASLAYHVVLTGRRLDPSGNPYFTPTELKLYVDGRLDDPATGLPRTFLLEKDISGNPAGSMAILKWENLYLSCVDEVRLYDTTLDAAQVGGLYALGRFPSSGTYTSPLYVPDAPARAAFAQWTGTVPPGFPDPDRRLQVEVEAYETAPGEPGHPRLAPGFPRTLAPSGVADSFAATGTGTFRSFRYRVRFDTAGAAAPVNESPVFESLWLSLQPGYGPGWDRWDAGPAAR